MILNFVAKQFGVVDTVNGLLIFANIHQCCSSLWKPVCCSLVKDCCFVLYIRACLPVSPGIDEQTFKAQAVIDSARSFKIQTS